MTVPGRSCTGSVKPDAGIGMNHVAINVVYAALGANPGLRFPGSPLLGGREFRRAFRSFGDSWALCYIISNGTARRVLLVEFDPLDSFCKGEFEMTIRVAFI